MGCNVIEQGLRECSTIDSQHGINRDKLVTISKKSRPWQGMCMGNADLMTK